MEDRVKDVVNDYVHIQTEIKKCAERGEYTYAFSGDKNKWQLYLLITDQLKKDGFHVDIFMNDVTVRWNHAGTCCDEDSPAYKIYYISRKESRLMDKKTSDFVSKASLALSTQRWEL